MEVNRIYNENCLDTMARMPDGFVDVVVTSPPYNLNQYGGLLGGKKTNYYADNLAVGDYFVWIGQVITELLRVSRHHVFFNIQEVSGNKGITAFLYQEFHKQMKETFVWAKHNPPAMGFKEHDTMCSKGFENIYCFSNDRPETRKFYYCNFSQTNGDYVTTSLISAVSRGYPGHNCVFPEHLPLFFIKNFSKEGALIYDPFMGSGTTAKASHQLGRNWIGSEISPEYVELANKRMEPYLAQSNLFA